MTGITYNFGANLLGNLTYSYDSLGRRTQVGGSFARTGFPAAVASATYDAANELTNWNGTPISYDLNGNMLSDGTNTFTWNARNQVATLNGVALQYDAGGRRIKNAAGTSFLFNGPNATQELSGSGVTSNTLTGGTDEVFQRADSNGTLVPLADALGSTIAMVDSSGSVVTSYSYDPFGNTTTAGVASANVSQYTGRENEGNGLYYYRARYYSPVLHRFVSQDPLGFMGGGVNVYAYAGNSPTNFRDPSGKNPACVVGGLLGTIAYNSYVIYKSLAGRKAVYYAGWSGLGHIAAGNAEAFAAGCALGSGVGELAGGEAEGVGAAEVEEATQSLTSGQMGGDIIGWGTGQSAEAVAQTEAVTETLTAESVEEMAEQGLTRDWVETQLGKYLESTLQDSKLSNAQLWPRINLMNRLLDLWPK